MAQPTSFIYQHNHVSQFPVKQHMGVVGSPLYGLGLRRIHLASEILLFLFFKRFWVTLKNRFILHNLRKRQYSRSRLKNSSRGYPRHRSVKVVSRFFGSQQALNNYRSTESIIITSKQYYGIGDRY